MSARHDLIVVGAGVSALTSALWLFECGLKPIVIPGPERSDLLPQLDLSLALPWRRSDVLNQLELRGLTLMPELITRLALETGVDLALVPRDLLLLQANDEADLNSEMVESLGMTRGPIGAFEPQLAEGFQDAWCLPARAAVRADQLARALGLALTRRGVEILGHRSVRRLDVAGNIVLGVELDNGEFVAGDATVLAADQSSNACLQDSGLETLTGDGELVPALLFNPSSAALGCAAVEPSITMAPREDGRLVAIANPEPGRESNPTSNRESTQDSIRQPDQPGPLSRDQLRREVYRRLPGLGRHDLERSASLPNPGAVSKASVGAYPGIRGLWMNVGHDAFGPMTAPAAAEFLREQLAGGPGVADLEPVFSPPMQPSC